MEEKRITEVPFDVNRVIGPDVIERTWQGIKRELARDGYPVEATKMPPISGWTLNTENLRKAWEIASSSPSLANTSQEEWGERSDEWAACTIPSVDQTSGGQGWGILIWEGMRPIRKPLRHELLHIWESLLGLKWGTLASKYQPEED
jgi:hypothetical protein